ncbi:MAG: hypothetical protein RIM99_00910 [Cyclobacteriaceae bacterium]
MKRILKHLNLKVLYSLFAVALVTSCEVDDDISPLPEEQSETIQEPTMMKLGKKLKNPYSVENMKLALENLKASGRYQKAPMPIIETTHLYVKFEPKDEEELDQLVSDSTLILYDYPLDVEIVEMGDYYRDPSVPDGQPTYQYTAVEATVQLPEISDTRVLDELYMPDDELLSKVSANFADDLETEALRITGNLKEIAGDAKSQRASKWRPAGRIMVWDEKVGTTAISRRVFSHYEWYDCGGIDEREQQIAPVEGGELGGSGPTTIVPVKECKRAVYTYVTDYVAGSYVPVVDVEVRARRWFTTHKGHTNSQGYYSVDGRFRRDANYSIKWHKYHFSVRSGTFGQAWLNGPKKKGDWNVNLGSRGSSGITDKQQYYAFIFQAARDYYYGNRFGLRRPPENGFWKPQVKISASQTERQHNKNSHAAPYARTGGIFPSVYIRTWGNSSDRVYAVTAHELAHMSHWDMDRSAFRSLAANAWAPLFPWLLLQDREKYAAVIESWATGVEWRFADHRYRTHFGITGYEYESEFLNGNIQGQRIAPFNADENDLIYTSVVVDLIDNCNQRDLSCSRYANTGTVNRYPMDRVSGYSIREVEDGLRGATSWNQWRDNMRNRFSNGTENQLNELFANWY